ncbi:molybdopterin dinucleotide binding domain-containing protein, partial [Pseudomonas syringae pv. tagetis]|uniref:molybdopterin dinucleotide binding domain-containing protein n=1 Tax=Pseudomonas syringae group genomosp. 7 TaxID=251699 RepID=UPI0037702166
ILAREPLTINPHAAQSRGLVDGDVVMVFIERGAFLAGVIVSDGIRPGVVQIATGAWVDPLVPGEQGSLDKLGNANV